MRHYPFYLTLLLVLLVACVPGAQPAVSPTATSLPPTAIPPTATPTSTPEPTLVPTPTQTNTPEPTATPTPIPFPGFTEWFRYYTNWDENGKTIVYFLNAGISQPLYAQLESHSLSCAHDPDTQSAMKCVADGLIELAEETPILVTFFADPNFYQKVSEYEIRIPKSIEPVYSNEFDCPLRGQNVHCESEYRLYGNLCTTSHTCYDACGYYYSYDNIPPGITEPWVSSGPCQ